MIIPVTRKYMAEVDERKPKIAIYYLFDNARDFGLCRTYRINWDELSLEKEPPSPYIQDKVILAENSFDFRKEKWLLGYMENDKSQPIKIEKIPDGVSFLTLSSLIAQVHFDEFLKRHDWICSFFSNRKFSK